MIRKCERPQRNNSRVCDERKAADSPPSDQKHHALDRLGTKASLQGLL